MPFLFTLPSAVRIFVPIAPDSLTLARTENTYPAGKTIVWRKIQVGVYDHRYKLVLELEGTAERHLLLLEEISPEFCVVAYEWTDLYEKVRNCGAAMIVVLPDLIPLLQKHMRRV